MGGNEGSTDKEGKVDSLIFTDFQLQLNMSFNFEHRQQTDVIMAVPMARFQGSHRPFPVTVPSKFSHA